MVRYGARKKQWERPAFPGPVLSTRKTKKPIQYLVVLAVCLSTAPLTAADAPAASGKAAEFAKVNKQWHDTLGDLTALNVRYHDSTDAAAKDKLKKEYTENLEKAHVLLDQLIDAAKNAFVEAPNADPEIAKLLVEPRGYCFLSGG